MSKTTAVERTITHSMKSKGSEGRGIVIPLFRSLDKTGFKSYSAPSRLAWLRLCSNKHSLRLTMARLARLVWCETGNASLFGPMSFQSHGWPPFIGREAQRWGFAVTNWHLDNDSPFCTTRQGGEFAAPPGHVLSCKRSCEKRVYPFSNLIDGKCQPKFHHGHLCGGTNLYWPASHPLSCGN
jgi:hypothetical protein